MTQVIAMSISVSILPTRDICVTILQDNKALAHVSLDAEQAKSVMGALSACIDIITPAGYVDISHGGKRNDH